MHYIDSPATSHLLTIFQPAKQSPPLYANASYHDPKYAAQPSSRTFYIPPSFQTLENTSGTALPPTSNTHYRSIHPPPQWSLPQLAKKHTTRGNLSLHHRAHATNSSASTRNTYTTTTSSSPFTYSAPSSTFSNCREEVHFFRQYNNYAKAFLRPYSDGKINTTSPYPANKTRQRGSSSTTNSTSTLNTSNSPQPPHCQKHRPQHTTRHHPL